jgi:methyl-accepting chemotaxis protein
MNGLLRRIGLRIRGYYSTGKSSSPDSEVTFSVQDESFLKLLKTSGIRSSDLTPFSIRANDVLPKLASVANRMIEVFSADDHLGRWITELGGENDATARLEEELHILFAMELDDDWFESRKKLGRSLKRAGVSVMTLTAIQNRLRLLLVEDGIKNEDCELLDRRLALERMAIDSGYSSGVDAVQGALAESQHDELRALAELVREAAAVGDLTSRSDLTRFPGFLRDLVAAMNELLDSILVPLREAIEVLERVAHRDLTPRLLKKYEGDHKLIPKALNPALDQLTDALREVNSVTEQVESLSGRVSEASQSLAAGATEQAATLEQIRATVEEITERTRGNARQADEAKELTNKAEQYADNGGRQMQEMVSAMKSINDSTAEIGEIINVIEDIAMQTKTLALNAGIEASRAGAQGTRFAVVAREVRELAERSARAVQETNALVVDTSQRVSAGSRIVDETEDAFQNIVRAVRDAAERVRSIDEATRDQSRNIEQVSAALGQVEHVTHTTAASSEETASVAVELSEHAKHLRGEVSKFKTHPVQREPREAKSGD